MLYSLPAAVFQRGFAGKRTGNKIVDATKTPANRDP